jgi:hypothetical protein
MILMQMLSTLGASRAAAAVNKLLSSSSQSSQVAQHPQRGEILSQRRASVHSK